MSRRHPLIPAPGAGKVMVVVGASRGIGHATARLAAREGYRLVLAARHRGPLDALRAAIERGGGEATCVRADVTDPRAPAQLMRRARARYGGVDALVLTAGLGVAGAIAGGRAADWRRVLEVNVLGVLSTARAAVPLLRERRGDLVLLSSVAALRVPPRAGVYAASKAAASALAESLRRELIPEDIRVIQVTPGAVQTRFKVLRHPPGREPDLGLPPATPLAAADVAEVILFALSRRHQVALSEIVVRPRDQHF